MRLISWNVNRRTQRARRAGARARRAAARRRRAAGDHRALVRPLGRPRSRPIGLPHVDAARGRRGRRRTGRDDRGPRAARAGREPRRCRGRRRRSRRAAGGVAVHTVHVPNAANGWVKPRHAGGASAPASQRRPGPRVLCGDLNTPRREHPDGTVISFARDTRERLREERGERWDSAELGVVPGLRDLGFADALRLHDSPAEPSWVFSPRRRLAARPRLPRRAEPRAGRRDLPPRAGVTTGLSDHSALEVDFQAAGRLAD